MRKIRLEVGDLRVETFATDRADTGKGTVRAREFTAGPECQTAQSGSPACPGCQNTGVASCVWCQRETETCQDCSWTNGDGAECYW